MLFDLTLREFLKRASSKSPAPGGGCVSAVTGALGAAMVAMVADLTVGKRGYEAAQDAGRETVTRCAAAIQELELLAEQDIEAFGRVMASRRMPSTTGDQRRTKAEAVGVAAEHACRIPLRICKTSVEILEQAARIAPLGTRSAIADVAVGAHLAHAAVRAAMLSVDANLPSIADEPARSALLQERDDLLGRADGLKLAALMAIARRS